MEAKKAYKMDIGGWRSRMLRRWISEDGGREGLEDVYRRRRCVMNICHI